MISNMFSIFDLKTAAFMQPFFMSTSAQAIRACVDTSRDPESVAFKHPEDFSLYQLGTFDDATGVFEGSRPVLIVVFSAFDAEVIS